MTTALLIIDVQHALCIGEEAAFDIDQVIMRINAISAKAAAAGVPVILIQHEEDDGSLQFDTRGWQLADDLVVRPGDLRIRKTAPDSFHQTGLQALLQEHGITRLVVCGLQSDFCVNSTVRRALELGYTVDLAADAHSTVDNGELSAAQITAQHNAAFARMAGAGSPIKVIPAAEIGMGI